jgi:hypothetical protein
MEQKFGHRIKQIIAANMRFLRRGGQKQKIEKKK